MKWNDILQAIQQMTPQQREQPALIFDDNEGEFCELIAMLQWDDPDSPYKDTFYLDQADNWWRKPGANC